MLTEKAPRKITLARAVLEKAQALEALGLDSIAGDLRTLVREHADTEDPEPEEGVELPSLAKLDPLPDIEETDP